MKQASFEQLREASKKTRVDEGVARAVLARVPPSWRLIQAGDQAAAFRRGNINVILTVEHCDDGNDWIHVSVSGSRSVSDRFLPDWEDLKCVKNDFIGAGKWAYQVLPCDSQYVNHCPYCLHLFSLFENRPALPDFTHGLGTL